MAPSEGTFQTSRRKTVSAPPTEIIIIIVTVVIIVIVMLVIIQLEVRELYIPAHYISFTSTAVPEAGSRGAVRGAEAAAAASLSEKDKDTEILRSLSNFLFRHGEKWIKFWTSCQATPSPSPAAHAAARNQGRHLWSGPSEHITSAQRHKPSFIHRRCF